ncbi:tyrosine-type recombinase/integrase [Streptomyces sp. NPDC048845]|uniref:tyrosine-type recombinase/integrase n=1 Tax=Streptomyces sp. NPDC048845 TaxID=3155390 RepID=UPI0034413F16
MRPPAGEIFGLPVEEVGFDSGWLHIANQVKGTEQGLVFAPPKRNKVRDVPLPDRVAHVLKQHVESFPPVEITLPWFRPDGPPVTKRLLFTRLDGTGAVRRTDFNDRTWKIRSRGGWGDPGAEAGRTPPVRPGTRHARLRHFYASVLLDAGENIKALSHHLGHNDPGFTLRVYTHLMPSSDARARKAVDGLYEGIDAAPDGPETAQGL